MNLYHYRELTLALVACQVFFSCYSVHFQSDLDLGCVVTKKISALGFQLATFSLPLPYGMVHCPVRSRLSCVYCKMAACSFPEHSHSVALMFTFSSKKYKPPLPFSPLKTLPHHHICREFHSLHYVETVELISTKCHSPSNVDRLLKRG